MRRGPGFRGPRRSASVQFESIAEVSRFHADPDQRSAKSFLLCVSMNGPETSLKSYPSTSVMRPQEERLDLKPMAEMIHYGVKCDRKLSSRRIRP